MPGERQDEEVRERGTTCAGAARGAPEDVAPKQAARRVAPAPLLPAAAAFAAGLAAAGLYRSTPYASLPVALAALVTLLLQKISSRSKAAAFAFLAAGFAAYFIYGPGAPMRFVPPAGGGPVRVTGEVVRPPEERGGRTLVFLRPDAPVRDGPRLPGRDGLIRLNISGTGLGVEYGDVLSARLALLPPKGFRNPGVFDWGEYARLRGEAAAAYAKPCDIGRIRNRAWPPLRGFYRLRAALGREAETSLPAREAALFRSLVLGDQGGVDEPMRDAFAASGTTHILSVSGTHVALLAGLVFFGLRSLFLLIPYPLALRLSMRLDAAKLAAALAIPAALAYSALAGMEVATVRSLIMITAFLVAVIIDREADVLNVLAAAALVVLAFDPAALFDISFQLSYGAVLCMALALRSLPQSWRTPDGRGLLRRQLHRASIALVASLAVIAGTAPLVARQFNSFSWVAPASNLVAVPLAGMAAVPLGLLSSLVYAAHPGAGLPLAPLDRLVLGAFYRVVEFFASAPYANLHPAAPPVWAILLFYAAVVPLYLARVEAWKKGAAAAGCLALVFVAGMAPPRGDGRLKVTFLDVGQGDSSVVVFPDGETMLIDGGGNPRGVDPGRAAVAPYLWNRGIRRLDYVVLTHPHPDHAAGLIYILRHFEAGQVWEGGMASGTPVYRDFRALVEAKGVPRRVFTDTGEVEVGGAAVQVLSTSAATEGPEDADDGPDGPKRYIRENNGSLVLRIRCGDTSYLFAGDAQYDEQEAMLGARPPLPLKSTVLKVPHHGGRSACDEDFIRAVAPRFAVISIGRANNSRGVPDETRAVLKSVGARVYDTDDDGAIAF